MGGESVPPKSTPAKALFKRMLPERLLIAIKRRRSLSWIRVHEPPEVAVMKLLAGQGDTVVDLGANVGYFTRCLSEIVGSGGHVLSVEPIPHTHLVLAYVVGKLRLRNVTLFQCGVSDVGGKAEMVVPHTSEGDNDYYEAFVVAPGQATHRPGETVSVELRTLDQIVGDRLSRLTFVKCDIEGHELNCLHGASDVLTRARPSWYMEIRDDPSGRGNATFKRMEQAGYAAYWYDEGILRRREGSERSENFFFLLPQHIAAIRNSSDPGVRFAD